MLFAISLTLLSVFALGFPFARWDVQLRQQPTLQVLGVVFGRGLLLGYALGLLTPSIRALSYGFGLAILAAIYVLGLAVRREGLSALVSPSEDHQSDVVGYGIAVFLLAVLFIAVTTDPIHAWDARSIWFFHAKVLYHIDRALDSKLWNSIGWSHLDYPKLNAMWAAMWMMHFRGWNEFLPKFSLVLLQIPVVFLCLGFSRSLVTRVLLVAALMLRNDQLIWNGYMDGILASYAGLAVLYGGRYVLRGASLDLMTMLVASGLCAGLKNEGLAFAACCTVFALLGRAWQVYILRAGPWRQYRDAATTAVYSFLGPAIWTVFAKVGGLTNDLVSAGGKGDRLHERLTDGKSFDAIWSGLTPTEDRSVFTFVVVTMLVYWIVNWRQFPRYRAAILFGVCVPAVYLALLVLVYLTTPWDLTSHLTTSVDRTGLVLHGCIMMALLGPLLGESRAPKSRSAIVRALTLQTTTTLAAPTRVACDS